MPAIVPAFRSLFNNQAITTTIAASPCLFTISVPCVHGNATHLNCPLSTRHSTRRIYHDTTGLCSPKPTHTCVYRIQFWRKPSVEQLRTMSSDDAYSSFLDQANQDTGASKASITTKTAATKAVDTAVPVGLQNVEQYYTSEADEPFEPVSLQWDGTNMPSEGTSGVSPRSWVVSSTDSAYV